MRSPQRLANGWPSNVIVKLNVGPLQGMFACPTMGQRSILVWFLLVYISARYWKRIAALNHATVGKMVGPSILDLTAVGQLHATQHYAYLLQLWAIWLPLVVITEYKLKMYIIIIKLCLIVVVKVTENISFMWELTFYPLSFWRASDPAKQYINLMYYRSREPIWRTSGLTAVGPMLDKCWADTFDKAILEHHMWTLFKLEGNYATKT